MQIIKQMNLLDDKITQDSQQLPTKCAVVCSEKDRMCKGRLNQAL